MLEKDFRFYIAHQDELVPLYNGKYVMIVDEKVVGAYDSLYEACYKGEDKYGPGNFLVQLCTPGDREYTIRYHSTPCFV